MAGKGSAWQGKAAHGRERQRMARHGWAWLGKAARCSQYQEGRSALQDQPDPELRDVL